MGNIWRSANGSLSSIWDYQRLPGFSHRIILSTSSRMSYGCEGIIWRLYRHSHQQVDHMLTQHNYAITAEDVVSIISGRFLIMRADDDAVDEQERARNAFNVHSSQDDIVKILRKFGTTNRRLTYQLALQLDSCTQLISLPTNTPQWQEDLPHQHLQEQHHVTLGSVTAPLLESSATLNNVASHTPGEIWHQVTKRKSSVFLLFRLTNWAHTFLRQPSLKIFGGSPPEPPENIK